MSLSILLISEQTFPLFAERQLRSGRIRNEPFASRFAKTRHRDGHHYLVLHCRAAQPHVTQLNHILGTSDATTNKCAADVRHHHHRSKQADAARKQEEDKEKKEKNTQQTGNLVKKKKQSSFDSGRVQKVSGLQFSLAK